MDTYTSTRLCLVQHLLLWLWKWIIHLRPKQCLSLCVTDKAATSIKCRLRVVKSREYWLAFRVEGNCSKACQLNYNYGLVLCVSHLHRCFRLYPVTSSNWRLRPTPSANKKKKEKKKKKRRKKYGSNYSILDCIDRARISLTMSSKWCVCVCVCVCVCGAPTTGFPSSLIECAKVHLYIKARAISVNLSISTESAHWFRDGFAMLMT